jgi:hypothetical protein
LWFSGNNNLVVSIMTPVRPVHSPVPRDVQAVLIDASQGKILGTHTWPAVIAAKAGLLATDNGNFVLHDKEGLALYSPTFQELKRIRLPDARRKAYEEWKVFVTPSRRFVVTAHIVGPDVEIKWLLAENLTEQRSWTLLPEIPRSRLSPTLSPSDNAVLVSLNSPAKCEVSVQDGVTSWRPVFHADNPCTSEAQFLTDRTFLLPLPHEFQVLDLEGRLLIREVLKKGESARDPSVTINGESIAISISTLKGGSEFLDINPHRVSKRIDVYDLRTKRCVYTVAHNLQHLSVFALSPDGLRLAILRERSLELHQIPSSGQTSPLFRENVHRRSTPTLFLEGQLLTYLLIR